MRRFLQGPYCIKGESVGLSLYPKFYYMYNQSGGLKSPRAVGE
jgi:hypothetical protein